MSDENTDTDRNLRGKITMNKLLAWGIRNSTANEDPTTATHLSKYQHLDPKIIDVLLGKPESDLMIEYMDIAVNRELDFDTREEALENFKDIIENMDNANIMKPCGIWAPLLSLFDEENSQIRTMSHWITATALQNNPIAISHFLEFGGLEKFLSCLPKEGDYLNIGLKLVNIMISLCNSQPVFINKFSNLGIIDLLKKLLLTPPEDLENSAWVKEPLLKRLLHFFSCLAAAPKQNAICLNTQEIKTLVSNFCAACQNDKNLLHDILDIFLRLLTSSGNRMTADEKIRLICIAKSANLDMAVVHQSLDSFTEAEVYM